MSNMKSIIKVSNIKKEYEINSIKINALNGISFDINEGEFVIVLGPSGSGKTTLLNIIGGMDKSSSGEFIFDNTVVSSLSNKDLVHYRRNKIGFVFQFYNLMPNLSALENVELATEICSNAYDPLDIIKKVGLEERRMNFPSQLSGGEQQRVSIARALAKNPSLLLCDEPTGALDYQTGKQILSLIHQISKSENKTTIIVTHNSAIKDMADKVIYIKNGVVSNIVENSNPKPIEEIEW